MADAPSSDSKDKSSQPAPEVLKTQAEKGSPAPDTTTQATAKVRSRLHHGTYRPSHKATFIGLAVVAAILALNAGVIFFVMKGQGGSEAELNREEVTLKAEDLEKLGMTKTPVGNLGTELVVGPDSRFTGKVTIGSDVSIAGQLMLNSKFNAADASLTRLEAGQTSVSELNVNGNSTASNMSLRQDLNVAGVSRFQGPVTMSSLLTINNNLNVAGNLAIGGTLSARGFQASSLTSDTTLTIGGHIITRGAAPGVGRGAALATADTVSISGNDAAGTVAVNIGTGPARSGIVAHVSFSRNYSNIPKVVVTAVGPGTTDVYINRSASGFSIGVGSISSGGHAFDFIVMQ